MTTFLLVLLVIVAILMVLVVLVQRGRGGGLAGAFGSGGGSNSAFGTKTGDVFTTITVVFFVVFMLLSVTLSYRFAGSKIAQAAPAEVKSETGDTGAPKTDDKAVSKEPVVVPPQALTKPDTNPATAPDAKAATVPAPMTAPTNARP